MYTYLHNINFICILHDFFYHCSTVCVTKFGVIHEKFECCTFIAPNLVILFKN